VTLQWLAHGDGLWRAVVPFGPADLDACVQRRGGGWEAMVVCGDSDGGGGYPMWQGGAATPYPDAEAAKRDVEARLAEWARDLAALFPAEGDNGH
jgi:hypothetical protein